MARADAFVRSCEQICIIALRNLRAIGEGQPPTPEQLADCREMLNVMVAAMNRRGTKLWTISRNTKTTVASTQTVDMDSNVLDISHLKVQINDVDFDVELVDRTEWTGIGDKTHEGQPVRAYLDRGVDPLVLYLHPVPDQAYTLVFDETRRLYKFDANSDEPDFPAHWIGALAAGLTASMAPQFRIPLDERNDLRAEARRLAKDAGWLDRGTSDTRIFPRAW